MDLTHANPPLFAALAAAQGEVENATKASTNPHFKSRYADLAEVLNTVRPVFAKHGLGIIQSTGFDGARVEVTTAITHKEGGFVTSSASCVPAKADAQGIGAATTYLRRYGLAAMAGIAQEDDDGNAAAHNRGAKPNPQLVAILEQIATVETVEALEAIKPDIRKLPAQIQGHAITAWKAREGVLKESK